jgi:predicted alpha/beta-fold hydrolase
MNTWTSHTRLAPNPFRPHRLATGGAVQTLLAMSSPRDVTLAVDEQPLLVDAGRDFTGVAPDRPVRMLAYFNRSRQAGPAKGLVIIYHGWEGCSHSNYALATGQRLVNEGYDIVRLNLRDHGPGLHVDPYALNPGIFLGILIDEAVAATRQLAALAGDKPVFLFGASMGGNIVLRIGIHTVQEPIPNLHRLVAVCPAINPASATTALDSRLPTRRYFRKRWLGSLLTKQRLFPKLYDFSPLEAIPLVWDMTDWMVKECGWLSGNRFQAATDYFEAYDVSDSKLQKLATPTTIIAAADDPIIPIEDFYHFSPHPLVDLHIHPTGGHVGFIDVLPMRHRLPDLLMEILQAA